MNKYRDAITGYEVYQYTAGPERNAKHYFSTENFSADDKYFFFTRTKVENEPADSGSQEGLYRAEVETGELFLLADSHYGGFAMHYHENYGVIFRDDGMIFRLNIENGAMIELGRLPKGAQPQGHLTVADDGRIACAVQLENKIYALVILDPGQSESRIVYMTDQRIGHSQICPSDSNLIFFVHETGGDALQRTWMFDVAYRMVRPYYVEHPNEWITHETWTADGSEMAFMWIPGKILIGDKDGRHFDTVFESDKRILHPGISRDKQWLCTDMSWEHADGKEQWAVVLINRKTGAHEILAFTKSVFRTGLDHLHPSFNRAGDKILFSSPDESGIAQVCVVDLKQVRRL